jgi:hypothetical protein
MKKEMFYFEMLITTVDENLSEEEALKLLKQVKRLAKEFKATVDDFDWELRQDPINQSWGAEKITYWRFKVKIIGHYAYLRLFHDLIKSYAILKRLYPSPPEVFSLPKNGEDS